MVSLGRYLEKTSVVEETVLVDPPLTLTPVVVIEREKTTSSDATGVTVTYGERVSEFLSHSSWTVTFQRLCHREQGLGTEK